MPNFGGKKEEDALSLEVYGENQGSVLAQYVIGKIGVPAQLVEPNELVRRGHDLGTDLSEGLVFTVHNKKQSRGSMGNPLSDIRYEPILPTLSLPLGQINLSLDALLTTNQDLKLIWVVHADNAPPITGTLRLGDIHLEDKRLS